MPTPRLQTVPSSPHRTDVLDARPVQMKGLSQATAKPRAQTIVNLVSLTKVFPVRDTQEPSQRRYVVQHNGSLPAKWKTLRTYVQRYGELSSLEAFNLAGDTTVYLGLFEKREAMQMLRLYGLKKQRMLNPEQPSTVVAGFVAGGQRGVRALWALDLSALLPASLRIEDLQLGDDGVLFFNAAYVSYAKEVQNRTAYLYAIDPRAGSVLWRTDALRSRHDFIVHGKLVITGYGFSREKDFLYVFDRSTGSQLQKLPIPSAHDRMRIAGDKLYIQTYDHDLIVAFATQRPSQH